MRRRFFLNFNPDAGVTRRAAVDRLVTDLEAAGATVTRASAPSAEAARRAAGDAARSGLYDAVLAAGGDGTIRQAAAALAGTDCPLGAVMLGTGNVLAHELDLPRTTPALANLLLHGDAIDIELGRANDEPFLLMAGAGFDGRVMAALDPRLKQRLAKLAFVPAVLGTLARPLDDLDVRIDGVSHRCTWAIVTRAGRYGGAFRLTEAQHLCTPGLVAVLFRASSKRALVGELLSLAAGRLDARAARGTQGVAIKPCAEAIITAATPVPAQLDGDPFGTTPLRITSGGGIVRMIAPAH
jgi:diacylglycerol kinase family enzyme